MRKKQSGIPFYGTSGIACSSTVRASIIWRCLFFIFRDCTAHGWLPPDSHDRERVIIGTSHGDLFFCESGELKCTLAPPAAYTASIECLVAYSKVIVLGFYLFKMLNFEQYGPSILNL
jgi:hypothetical protein